MIPAIFQPFSRALWLVDIEALPVWQQVPLRFLRILLVVTRDVTRSMLTLHAMSLVYTTLLSFVPLLAVSFSVLKGFGVHNQIEPLLLGMLQPLGAKSVEITANIVGFVENMKIGVLSALGLGVLMYTVISLIQKIEAAFNYTWRLTTARNFTQRFSNYLSVIMVGPVLVFSAMGITASLNSQTIMSVLHQLPFAGEAFQLVASLLPYVLIIAAFALVYLLVPNTRVKLGSALYGAIVAGITWRWTGELFASFAGGSTSYTAIYSGFAILLLFMIWLYLGWLILLIGASIAFYHQHPERLTWASDKATFSAIMRENMALQLMLEIGRAHYQGDGQVTTLHNLAARLRLPDSMIENMLTNLEISGLIVRSSEKDSRYLPLRSIDQIGLIDILKAARVADDNGLSHQLHKGSAIDRLQQDMESSIAQVLNDKSLKDLVLMELE